MGDSSESSAHLVRCEGEEREGQDDGSDHSEARAARGGRERAPYA